VLLLLSGVVAASLPGAELLDRSGPDSLVGDAARGRALFSGRGRCVECHHFEGRGRQVAGPSLDAHWAAGPALAARLPLRPRPAGWREEVPGDAYLLQSLIEPAAFVADGWTDAMPAADGALLRLGRQDLADLLALLNPAPAGTPRWIPEIGAAGPDPWRALPHADVARGEELFFRSDDSACSGCHLVRVPRLEERFHAPFWKLGGLVGPELTRLALVAGPDAILASIVRPNAARTSGFRDMLLETEGERLLTGLLVAQGAAGALLLEASPQGPLFQWIDADSIASIDPVTDSRMTHVFAELLDPGQRLDVLAFLRAAALESAALGEAALPGGALGARDPAAALYTGRWPAAARPELLQQIPGLFVAGTISQPSDQPRNP